MFPQRGVICAEGFGCQRLGRHALIPLILLLGLLLFSPVRADRSLVGAGGCGSFAGKNKYISITPNCINPSAFQNSEITMMLWAEITEDLDMDM